MDNQRDIIERYLADELSEAEHAELTAWLQSDETNRRAFLAEIDFYRTVRSVLTQEQQDLAKVAEASGSDEELAPIHIDAEALTKAKYVSALSYVIKYTFTPRRMVRGGLAIAAVLLLALILFNPFVSDLSEHVAVAPADQDPSTENTVVLPSVVATLTAEHDAQWSTPGGTVAPLPGDTLRAGQRLALTAGYAEITTRRGAVAIIEAPATLEFSHNDNAIGLIAGQLVGICETASSKGFVVRTPQMLVTDLGTRFGVIVDEQASAVRVLDGVVEASAVGAEIDATPTRLTAGQTAVAQDNAEHIKLTDDVSARFVQDWRAIANAPELTGMIRYEPVIHPDLRLGMHESNEIQVFHERSSIMPELVISANITMPGDYVGQDWLATATLDRVTVDSYLVHFDRVGVAEEITRRNVTLRFDRPILGVITTSEQLAATHSAFGVPGVLYGSDSEWLPTEFHEARDGSGLDISSALELQSVQDAVHLSEDRKTLTLDLAVVEAIDQVRVLVQSEINRAP